MNSRSAAPVSSNGPLSGAFHRFDLSAYPKSFAEMEGSKWATMMRDSQSNASRINSRGSFRSLVEQLGPKGGNLMREVFEVSCRRVRSQDNGQF